VGSIEYCFMLLLGVFVCGALIQSTKDLIGVLGLRDFITASKLGALMFMFSFGIALLYCFNVRFVVLQLSCLYTYIGYSYRDHFGGL
jgi:hypothetical protein